MQAAGQIADLGGGALMAAFGILAALRERDRSGEGQLVDVSMADGALAWLAMVAARYFADGDVPGAATSSSPGALVCYRPYACADGWVTLGALEPKFWQRVVPRRRPRGPRRAAVRRARLRGARARSRRSSPRARAREWEAFASEHDCCLEPVLELDEALDSELVRAREMVVELDQPGAQRAGAPARRAGQARAHAGRPDRAPGPGAGRAHRASCCASAGYGDEEIAALRGVRRGGRPGGAGAAGASCG